MTSSPVRSRPPVATAPRMAPANRSGSVLRASVAALTLLATAAPFTHPLEAQDAPSAARKWTFLEAQRLNQAGSPALSRDGSRMLYTLSTMDWSTARRSTDIWVVSTTDGVGSGRQLTFTTDRSENAPQWAPDGASFVFTSNRDATGGAGAGNAANGGGGNQLYWMRLDGGEARRLTDAKDGVGQARFSPDGGWLAWSAGKSDEQQVWGVRTDSLGVATPRALTKHVTPVSWWQMSKDGRSLFFLAADTLDTANKQRLEKKFDVRVRNQDAPLTHLWMVDLATGTEKRLTGGTAYAVTAVTLSDDGRWAGFRGLPNDRYVRTITEANNFGDLYLLNLQSGAIERLTTNRNISESPLSFAPDGKTIAFSASDDFTYFRANKVWVRDISATNGPWRKLGGAFDGDVNIGWWSSNADTIYFNEGIRATNQLLALAVSSNTVRQVTDVKASLTVQRDDDSGLLLLTFADPKTPTQHFVVSTVADVANRNAWRQVTDANPHVRAFALGDEEEVCWRSTDRKQTCGILVKPVGYTPGTRYPLIVAIHGGPQSADVLGFNGGYGAQAYAADGYMVLKPNYRGSTNYGEAHKWGIVNDYFRLGYDDIMTGVDRLIADGLVDGSRMGVLGWSAGGHWTNWIITHTNRFKAASSGAGTVNWISMYGQSDMQDVRSHYLGGRLPYEDFDAYWKQSPIRYIRNAKTPTMIHVVDGDPRVPRPQSDELHMALRRLGVPTEYYVYPGMTHGIPDPRNQYLKSVSEKAWMDHWIKGAPKFRWEDVLQSLETTKP